MKRKLLKVSVAIIAALAITSCGASSKLVGKWSDGNGLFGTEIQFSESGKVVIKHNGNSADGTYKVSGDTIELSKDGNTTSCPYELDGDMLEINIEGETLHLSR